MNAINKKCMDSYKFEMKNTRMSLSFFFIFMSFYYIIIKVFLLHIWTFLGALLHNINFSACPGNYNSTGSR